MGKRNLHSWKPLLKRALENRRSMKVALALGFVALSVALVSLVFVGVVFVKSIGQVSELLRSDSSVVKAQSLFQTQSMGEINLAGCLGAFQSLAGNFEQILVESPRDQIAKLKQACLSGEAPPVCVNDQCDPI